MSDGTIYLADYQPPDFLIDQVALRFELGEEQTLVQATLELRRNPARPDGGPGLSLHGRQLELRRLALDGVALPADAYQVDADGLHIAVVPDALRLEIETLIRPQDNTELSGLYKSSGNFCTQCEPEGFRKITYFLDRPDVMARYTTTVVAEAARYPVLLSNGNKVGQGVLEDGRHWARWEDPFPKPSYLFALVAGDLHCHEGRFTTCSGREVALQVYVEHRNADKCEHALRSMAQAMRWDEQAFGREYDLDAYMIVAVDDFNMGAMENKGLNIFNSAYVLARPDTATDADYESIQGVIGHEYFHNWSGNRVTCRDWFQLSLKEGFTVFRDQQFTAAMTSAATKRIADANVIRTYQFREDGGPLAHPVRPASYQEINNFYTLTVYNKGAEVVRMLHTLLGAAGFRRGTDLYFSRHDGQAVTTDDFVKAMEDANQVELGQFKRWYSQAGTPVLGLRQRYDPAGRRLTLTLSQSCPPTPGQEHKEPFVVPVRLAMLGPDGAELPLQLEGEPATVGTERTLELRRAEQSFTFVAVDAPPRLSLLRGFSAPVKVERELDDAELAFLMAHDRDAFVRWDAGQQLGQRVVERRMASAEAAAPAEALLLEAFTRCLQDPGLDRRLKAQALALPSELYLAEVAPQIDPGAIHEARQAVRRAVAERLKPLLRQAYDDNLTPGPYQLDAESVGRRMLKNLSLAYLMELEEADVYARCLHQYRTGSNMTDTLAALFAVAGSEHPEREPCLDDFYTRWKADPLVVDKWFSVQASSKRRDTLARVRALSQHEAFSLKNPNRVRALVGAFAQANPARFHDPSGEGYAFLADHVLKLDAINPQVSARMVMPLGTWMKYEPGRRDLMRAQLERLAGQELSKNLREMVSRSLATTRSS